MPSQIRKVMSIFEPRDLGCSRGRSQSTDCGSWESQGPGSGQEGKMVMTYSTQSVEYLLECWMMNRLGLVTTQYHIARVEPP